MFWRLNPAPPLVPQAQQLVQVEAAKVQEELANTVVEGFSSDETVRPAPLPAAAAAPWAPCPGGDGAE